MLHFSTFFDLVVWLFLDIIIPYVLLIKPSDILMMEMKQYIIFATNFPVTFFFLISLKNSRNQKFRYKQDQTSIKKTKQTQTNKKNKKKKKNHTKNKTKKLKNPLLWFFCYQILSQNTRFPWFVKCKNSDIFLIVLPLKDLKLLCIFLLPNFKSNSDSCDM